MIKACGRRPSAAAGRDPGRARDLLGYSLGGGASLRCAIAHPSLVRRLVLLSAPHRQSAWYPEIRAAWDGMDAGLFEQFKEGPLYAAWRAVAPDDTVFPALLDATGALLRQPYDWSAEVAALPMPLLLVYGDADSIPPLAILPWGCSGENSSR